VSSGTSAMSLADAAKAVGELLEQSTKLGMELLGSVKLPLPSRSSGCSCEIPPPCWAPQPAGDIKTRACPGDTAVLRLHITNCGAVKRQISVDATNKAVAVQPASLTVEPFDEETVVLSLDISASAKKGEQHKTIVWVHGCYLHYVRWRIEVTDTHCSCVDDVDIEDCPDLVHHWYDHFYCDRPCLHRR
jgi:hypothetical protein